MDDSNDGHLDMEEFHEALHEIDDQIKHNDIEHIFKSLRCGKEDEISIQTFVDHVRKSYNVNDDSMTPKTLFRKSFQDILQHIDDGSERKLWGDAQV